MTDHLGVPDEHDEPEDDASLRDDERAGAKPPALRGPLPSLDAFSAIQRKLAAVDFSALTAAQRTIEQAAAFRLTEVVAAQDAVAKHFADSIDFSRLGAANKALLDAGTISKVVAAQAQWAETLAKSVDFSALNSALASSAALAALTGADTGLVESLERQTEIFSRIAETVAFKLPTIDVTKWIEALDRWIPSNLRDVADLDAVASISLNKGLPLSWVPRTEIVLALVEAEGEQDRDTILAGRRDDILDDCETALASIKNEWAVQCRAAIGALSAGFGSPAQSHASNIIDSVVLALHGKQGRDHAKDRARERLDDLPLQLAAENLTLRPLFRAFSAWWPSSGDFPPDHFARHPTSHAVGHVGVFSARSALVAVMLATSLTVQYSPREPAPTGEHPEMSP